VKILILRSYADRINTDFYNMQEIGLAKSLVKLGNKCDIVFYTSNHNIRIQRIAVKDNFMTVYLVPALRIMKDAVYLKLIKTQFFDKYDVIQTSAYLRIMNFILPFVTKTPIVMYQGPYKDISPKFFNRIYDFLFLRSMRKRITLVLTKSILAKDYLGKKGFRNIFNIGVGIDIEKFNKEGSGNATIYKFIENLKKDKKKVLLYIGKIEDRRNIPFIFEVFSLVRKKIPDLKLIMVGDGEPDLVDKYFNDIKEADVVKNIVHLRKVKQQYIKQIYKLSDIFILPTKYAIFGMVILESMFFKVPVCTTRNGGSVTLIKNGENGIIFDEFDSKLWSNRITELLSDEKRRREMGKKAYETIINNFTWDKLSYRFISMYKMVIENSRKIKI